MNVTYKKLKNTGNIVNPDTKFVFESVANKVVIGKLVGSKIEKLTHDDVAKCIELKFTLGAEALEPTDEDDGEEEEEEEEDDNEGDNSEQVPVVETINILVQKSSPEEDDENTSGDEENKETDVETNTSVSGGDGPFGNGPLTEVFYTLSLTTQQSLGIIKNITDGLTQQLDQVTQTLVEVSAERDALKERLHYLKALLE